MTHLEYLVPGIDLPPGVRSAVTCRGHGVGLGQFAGNIADHVGDDPGQVEATRKQLGKDLGITSDPLWLRQVHGHCVVDAAVVDGTPEADASYSIDSNIPLVVMTADCLPILLCSADGREIGAVHAGWRGLACGVIKAALDCFQHSSIRAYVGPGIGPCHYEVDETVYSQFESSIAFEANRPGHWRFDLGVEAARQLTTLGVELVYREPVCTCCDGRFFSHRGDLAGTAGPGVAGPSVAGSDTTDVVARIPVTRNTGRFASLIWRVDP